MMSVYVNPYIHAQTSVKWWSSAIEVILLGIHVRFVALGSVVLFMVVNVKTLALVALQLELDIIETYM